MSNVSTLTATGSDRLPVPENMVREHTTKLRDMIQLRTDLRLEINRLSDRLNLVEQSIQVHETVLNSLR